MRTSGTGAWTHEPHASTAAGSSYTRNTVPHTRNDPHGKEAACGWTLSRTGDVVTNSRSAGDLRAVSP